MATQFPVNLVKLAGMFSPGGEPINQGDLKYVGQKGDGLVIFGQIEAVPGMSVQFGTPPSWPYQVVSLDGVTNFWFVWGTYNNNGAVYDVYEGTGDLADRAQHPNPFTDRDANGATGKTLKFRQVAQPMGDYHGVLEFYYGA
jgi:hypothetical protein